MTEGEDGITQEHKACCLKRPATGNVIALGVVAELAGVFGAGSVQFATIRTVHSLTATAPTVLSLRVLLRDPHMPFGSTTA